MSQPARWELAPILPITASTPDGVLSIGGCSLAHLADQFGTPLYVFDETTLRRKARSIPAALGVEPSSVRFALKACATIAVLRVLSSEGLRFDAVSAGEIEAALRAGVRPEHLYLHGNAKSDEDLDAAVSHGLAAIVADSLGELARLEALAARAGRQIPVIFRVNLALNVQTHGHLRTSGRSSKFGMGPDGVREGLDRVRHSALLRFIGLHTHPGSQIADARVYRDALVELNKLAGLATARGLPVEEICLGGGWAVPYRPGDASLAPEILRTAIEDVIPAGPRLTFEPGRAMVAGAAVALYRVISVKQTDEGSLIAVDGGMGDNPRPAMYGARYGAIRVSDPSSAGPGTDRVVGRYCEEGDFLACDVNLPAQPGELIAIPVAGAYQLSMASAYNLVPPPAAVLLANGAATLVRRRATVADLLSADL